MGKPFDGDERMAGQRGKWLKRAVWTGAIVLVVVLLAWRYLKEDEGFEGIASSNGRIQAIEINVASKLAGRVESVLVNEGDFVVAGQVLARIDADVLRAQLRQAQAQVREAESSVATARSQLAQRESEKSAAQAVVAQRQAEFNAARKRSLRSSDLAAKGASPQQQADDDLAAMQSASAAVSAAQAQVAAAEAAIITAHSELHKSRSSLEAATAAVERIQVDIADSELKAPRDGRVQYRVAEVGEILGIGGVVLNMLDLSDVYMNFFLPTAAAGRVAIGSEVRLVLDAAPQYVIPARATFVASGAQFTPREVETESERQKLMFRVKAQISPDLLRKHITYVKTGLPGMAYVRLDPQVEWPPELQVKLPQ